MTLRAKPALPVIGGAAIIGLSIAMVAEFTPRLVWNVTPSAPIGLYVITEKAPVLGSFLLVEPSINISNLIEKRQYLPPDTPFLKRVVALSGAEICRENEHVFVTGAYVAEALLVDSMGREMPQWNGCFTLKSDEIFLLNDHEKSLDGRYFGATNKDQVIGVAMPLFMRDLKE